MIGPLPRSSFWFSQNHKELRITPKENQQIDLKTLLKDLPSQDHVRVEKVPQREKSPIFERKPQIQPSPQKLHIYKLIAKSNIEVPVTIHKLRHRNKKVEFKIRIGRNLFWFDLEQTKKRFPRALCEFILSQRI